MAAATVSPMPVDLKSSTSCQIRLGSSILEPDNSRRYLAARYNYKPKQTLTEDATSHIGANGQLDLDHDDEQLTYSGRKSDPTNQYVMLFQGDGRDKTVVLERLDSSHDFNLISTSTEKDRAKLAEEYPHIPFDQSDSDDLFGEDDNIDGEADDDNPFDFRHFLTLSPVQPSEPTKDEDHSKASSTMSNTAAKPTKRAADFVQPAGNKKRKTGGTNSATSKAASKRVRAGAEDPAEASEREQERSSNSTNNKSMSKPSVPRLRLDRKASLRRPSLDDSGELILENETPISEKPASAMTLALTGQLGSGPISLRSAANSPASLMASPMPKRPAGVGDEEDGSEIGGSSPEDGEGSMRRNRRDRATDDDDDVDGDGDDADEQQDEDENDADADVEDLELPSPAQQKGDLSPLANLQQQNDQSAAANDDDMLMQLELERELQQELGQADDEMDVAAPPVEEEEVSEEE